MPLKEFIQHFELKKKNFGDRTFETEYMNDRTENF